MDTIFTHCTVFPGSGMPPVSNAFLAVSGSTITGLGKMTDAPDIPGVRTVDCSGKLLMPGLINGHNHCAMTLFRGLADDLALSDWLHGHIFPAEKKHVSKEMVYWCSRLAAAEMLLSGTTCVADGYFFSGEAARALRDCGMRAVIGHGIVDFPAPSVPDPAKNIEAVAAFLDEWLTADPLITPAVFAHAPYTCSPKTLRRAKDLADMRGVRFFTHLAESQHEAKMIIDLQDKTPLGHVKKLGILDRNAILVHAVWLNDQDLDRLAASGAHVVGCPQSNMKLASGVARVPDMIQRDITVGLGTDGCASNNSLDMFREMDMLAKLHKMAHLDATTLPARTAFGAATEANSKLLGLHDIGRLAVGMKADLVVLNLQKPHLTPFYSPDLLVYAASGRDVETVMVHGKIVVEKREILSFDLRETMAKVKEIAGST